ncbi:MAG: hypothetical protein M1814_006320 [Vezdaea aestivalis]|nr:MAG: hypothetical protein M1814_006320 [Vezdaea aestivalis]
MAALPSPSFNPEMILPYEIDHSQPDDFPRQPMAPPSPPRRTSAGLSSHPVDPGHMFSLGRPLSDIQEAESIPKGRRSRNDLLNSARQSPPFPSSPTLATSPTTNSHLDVPDFLKRTASTGSSHGISDYYGYDRDEHAIEDDSDEEMTNYGEDEDEDVAELENIKRLRKARLQYHGGINAGPPEDTQDPYLSAALSERAAKILENAKRRLDNMEGNLHRARNSLIISSSPLMAASADNSPPISQPSYSTIHGAERRLHPPLGISPAKHRQVKMKSYVANNGGHSRVFSETSIPSTLNTASRPDGQNPRSISAFENENSAKGRTNCLSPAAVAVLKGIRREESEEALRKRALQGESASPTEPSPTFERHLARVDEENHSLARQLSTSASLYNMAPTGPAEQANGLSRSKSTAQMRDLRVQMNDLKGKISTLQQKAREEGLKRRSLQSLRTPSPFTAAEQWYTTAVEYKQEPTKSNLGLKGVEPDTLVGQAPPRPHAPERHDSALKEDSKYAESMAPSYYHDADEEIHTEFSDDSHEDLIQSYKIDEGRPENVQKPLVAAQDDDNTSLPAGERHEDREDAFDYQNFFLHSGMGNYSQTDLAKHRTRDSCSSNDSTATTRAIDNNPRLSSHHHQRNISSDSVSTVASFATATEGFGSGTSEASDDDDDRNPARHLPSFGIPSPKHRSPPTQQPSTFTTPRSAPAPSAAQMASASSKVYVAKPTVSTTAIASYQPSLEDTTPTTREFPLINRSKLASTRAGKPAVPPLAQFIRPASPSPTRSTEAPSEGTDATSLSGGSVPEGGNQLGPGDRALVEALVEAMGDVCVSLKREEGGPRAGIWRGRLEAARRVLEGAVL